ncbi:YdcF family protein [Leifsonia sp. PS1209]|uniref:YdcF family protein n=1 Tax=Leifsonia sp. PS1209 TaxID=2724914 RepID=UPI001442AA35|nr:YdcF family protein [Leifsonia sp. PS1209]QJA00569.1 YdcF family protein [Leifsonia sp. PS1209]
MRAGRVVAGALAVGVAGAAAVLAWAELLHWRASRRGVDRPGVRVPRLQAVVVLGFRNRGRRANAVNRYRVRAGLRSLDPRAQRSVLVLCGGAVGGEVPEAVLMARYARESRRYTGAILLDTESTTTWENLRNAIPLIEDADSIAIVSNSLHAEKGRNYLRALRPDLGARLRRAEDYRFGEIALVKPVAAVAGIRARRRAARAPDAG